MSNHEQLFMPDWLIHPGEHLAEYLEAYEMSQAELAERTGLHRKTINDIIKGRASITPETALLLEPVFARPAHFWMNLDRQYHEGLARQARKQLIEAQAQWVKRFPLKEMRQRGVIPHTHDVHATGVALLAFFGVGTIDAWHTVWHQDPLPVTYRQQRNETRTTELLSVWLREGQHAVEHRECQPFDAAKLRESIPLLRQLTTQTPVEFWPTLETVCANAGVCVVQVAPYPKLAVYGATYRYRGKTVVQVSNHRRTVDQFWFTFFHEVGHLLLHGIKDYYIEGEHAELHATDDQEREADAFATRTLIPEGAWNTYVHRTQRAVREHGVPYQLADIERFADQQKIDVSIVIGRLQHESHLPYRSPLSSHKRALVWE